MLPKHSTMNFDSYFIDKTRSPCIREFDCHRLNQMYPIERKSVNRNIH